MNNRPRIVVFAYSEPGYTCLKELINAQANILAVYTHIDDPNEEIWFHSVYELAQKHNIPVFRPAKITDEIAQEIKQLEPELIFSFYFRRLIPNEIILAPRLGSYNLHGALLPKYRGQTCINWAVVNGETRTGVTLHLMTDKADEGGIAAQSSCDIAFSDTSLDVFKKISVLGAQLVKDMLPSLEAGTVVLMPQDESKATKYPRRRPKDGLIDFTKDAVSIYNLIRGVTHPFPGAFTFTGGKKLFIWQAIPLKNSSSTIYNPGEIVSTEPLCVSTGKGLLQLKQLQFENETEEKASSFVDRLPIGTKFIADN